VPEECVATAAVSDAGTLRSYASGLPPATVPPSFRKWEGLYSVEAFTCILLVDQETKTEIQSTRCKGVML
jgi:hypothetical protein